MSEKKYELVKLTNEDNSLLNKVKEESDMVGLGYKLHGPLKEENGYRKLYENHNVWVKVDNEEKTVKIVVTLNKANGGCIISYVDLFLDSICK